MKALEIDPDNAAAWAALAGVAQEWEWDWRARLSPGYIAYFYAEMDEADSAFVRFEKAYERRAFPIHVVAVSQWCRFVRSDPRFDDLLKRMKLEHVDPAYDY